MSGAVVGAAVVVWVNKRPFGVATSFRWTSATPKKPLYGLDNPDPYELGVTTTKIEGVVSVYRIDGDGGAEGWGMTANFEEISREKYYEIMLVNRLTDRVIFHAEHCTTQNQNWEVSARGVMSGTIQFEALSWSNEVKPFNG